MDYRKTSRHCADVRAYAGFYQCSHYFGILTPREQEVMAWITGGLLNKQVAAEIGVTEVTVKVHRGNVMRKMAAKSFADLVGMADLLGIRRTKS